MAKKRINWNEWSLFYNVGRWCIYVHDETEQWLWTDTYTASRILWTMEFTQYLKGEYEMLRKMYGHDIEQFDLAFEEWFEDYQHMFD